MGRGFGGGGFLDADIHAALQKSLKRETASALNGSDRCAGVSQTSYVYSHTSSSLPMYTYIVYRICDLYLCRTSGETMRVRPRTSIPNREFLGGVLRGTESLNRSRRESRKEESGREEKGEERRERSSMLVEMSADSFLTFDPLLHESNVGDSGKQTSRVREWDLPKLECWIDDSNHRRVLRDVERRREEALLHVRFPIPRGH